MVGRSYSLCRIGSPDFQAREKEKEMVRFFFVGTQGTKIFVSCDAGKEWKLVAQGAASGQAGDFWWTGGQAATAT